MNTYRKIGQQCADWGSRAAILLVFTVGVTVLLLWLAGNFAPKVSMQVERVSASEEKTPGIVAKVRLIRRPLVETAVGTIRPVHETTIGAKLLARVVEANLKAGQVVKAGDVLVRLDDIDLRARRRQSEAVLNAAEAARVQAEADANRAANLVKSRPSVSRKMSKPAPHLSQPMRNLVVRRNRSMRFRPRSTGPRSGHR